MTASETSSPVGRGARTLPYLTLPYLARARPPRAAARARDRKVCKFSIITLQNKPPLNKFTCSILPQDQYRTVRVLLLALSLAQMMRQMRWVREPGARVTGDRPLDAGKVQAPGIVRCRRPGGEGNDNAGEEGWRLFYTAVGLGLGRIVALYDRSSTSYHIH